MGRARTIAVVCPALLVVGCLATLGFGARAAPRTDPSPPPRLMPGQHTYSAGVRVMVAGHVVITHLNFLLYAPAAYGRNPKRRWPLIVFLHGGGERGDDPAILTRQPLPKTLSESTTFPAIVFSPQLPLRFRFWTEMIEPVDAVARRLEARYAVDRHRVYLTGLSTGGFGTWQDGLRHPQLFAALVPIAGGYPGTGVPAGICALRRVPIWAFHGAADTTVFPYQEEAMVKTLRRCGSKVVRLSILPGVGHSGSWLRAYADPLLWRWLFSQRLR